MLVFLQLMANEVETHKIADQPTPPKELAWKVWMAKVKTFSLFSKGSTPAIFLQNDTTGSSNRVQTRWSCEEATQSGNAIQMFNVYIMDLPTNGMLAVILGTAHLISMTMLMAILESEMILLLSNQLLLPLLPKSSILLLYPLKYGWRNKPTMDESFLETITLGKSS